MLQEELVDLVLDIVNLKCERQNIELKKASGGTPERLYNTLSSFSNQNGGGIIIFGIDEDDGYKICGVYDPQDLQKKVTEQALQMMPVVRPLFTIGKIGDAVVVSAEISECELIDKPCYYKGTGKLRGSFVRVGEADLPMTEYEIYSYEAYKRKIHDEIRTVPNSSISAINKNELTVFLAKLKSEKPNLANLSDEENLALSGILVDNELTVAGLMLFGLYPQGLFPQLCITAVVVPGKEIGDIGEENDRFLDNKKIEGTIPQMIDGAINFVKRNMKSKTIIDDEGKRADKSEYPLKAVREIIINAVVHRDYSFNTENSPVRIMLFSDRLEVENPGGLYGRITIDNLGKVGADTRNPFIASNLEILINTENRFSGIPTIRNEMKTAGLLPPLFENIRGVFKVTLFNSESAYAYPVEEESLTTENILGFCKTPRSREEIAEYLGLSSVTYAMRNITPLIENGKIKMIKPETPKSKNQRYRTV
ncbi:MAG: ATP-binding protein [Eubacteriales bacterium]